MSLLAEISAIEFDGSSGSEQTVWLNVPIGATLEICAEGFDELTLQVRAGGHTCFIFLDDIMPREQSTSDDFCGEISAYSGFENWDWDRLRRAFDGEGEAAPVVGKRRDLTLSPS
jgi:hypothetical protein